MAFRGFKTKKKNKDELLTKLHTAETPYHVIKYLKKGIWPEQLNREGDAPIHYYVKRTDKNYFDCLMAFLIHSPSLVDQVNNDGMTALHLACERNDFLSTKALIAFDANLNLINYDNCTPLDIVLGCFKSESEIPQILSVLGGRQAIDVRSLHKNESEGYQENPMASYFTDTDKSSEDKSSEDKSYGEPQQTIRTRFGLDFQLMSMRNIDGHSLRGNHVVVHAEYYGGLDFHDGREESPAPVVDKQPASIPLESLPEVEEPVSPPPHQLFTTVRFQTPEASIENALTGASVTLAKQRVDDPEDSILTKKGKYLNGSPGSTSPVSTPAEPSMDEEVVHPPPVPVEKLAAAYSVNFLTKTSQGKGETSYQAVSSPMSPQQHYEIDAPTNAEQRVHFAHPPLSDAIAVNGKHYKEFQQRTAKALEEAVDFDPTKNDDESFAAWLQWREMVRAKKRKAEIWKHLGLGEDHADSPEPEKPPPKPPTVRRENVRHRYKRGAQGRDRQKLFSRQASSGGSLNMMKSLRNPNVGVLTSMLGSSVAPFMTETAKGERVLCLDGGGIKGLIQIEILKHIETVTEQKIVKLFDWIVGTSTGGILALALVYGGRTLDEMKQMFFELKDTVFKKQSKLLPTACDTDALEELLKKNLGEHRKMRDVTTPKVMITAVDKRTTDLPLIFFNNCFNDDYTEQHVWKVGRYTSAAPLYFKELDNYVDGGVVANNPSQYALTKIQTFLRDQKSGDKTHLPVPGKPASKPKKPKLGCMLSIGCGVFPPEPIGNTDILDAIKVSKIHHAPQKLVHLVTLLTSTLSKSEDVAEQCQNSCEEQEIPFYRFNPKLGETIKTDETDNEKLCDLIIGAKQLLCESEDHLLRLVQHLTDDILIT